MHDRTLYHVVGADGIGPSTSFLSGTRSTSELSTPHNKLRLIYGVNPSIEPYTLYQKLRLEAESNRCIAVLQTAALPLRHRAISELYFTIPQNEPKKTNKKETYQ